MKKTKNILVTEFGENGENVMIFTDWLTTDEIKKRLDANKCNYTDIVEVPDSDCQYYLYEPLWI
ncbi:MAG: hypothetical protein ACFFDN_05255 [Candidatus Hodarchaeota archaeon]